MKREELDVVLAQLRDAVKYKKCWTCGCQQSFVRTLREHLNDLSESERAEIEPLLRQSEATFRPAEYDCLGCNVCFPAIATNALVGAVPAFASGDSCGVGSDDKERAGWPPLPGDYHILRYHASVAICTLNSSALASELSASRPEGCAIVGGLHTENLGIERLIKNVVANGNIRFLLLCGEDSRQRIGHLPGQSLVSLFENGIDERGRIIGAQGKRPFLKNVDGEMVRHFKQQVRLVSKLGCTDAAPIVEAARLCAREGLAPFETAALGTHVPVFEASDRAPLVLDPNGYFVIFADKRRQRLVVEHYSNEGVLDKMLEGDDIGAIYASAVAQKLVSRLDHACYLGQELARAEGALKNGEEYVQDQAPEPLCAKSACTKDGCS